MAEMKITVAMTISVTGWRLHTFVIWMEKRMSHIDEKIFVQLDHIEEPPNVFFHGTIFNFLCKYAKAFSWFYCIQDERNLDIFQGKAVK